MKRIIALPNCKSIVIRQLVYEFVLTGKVLPVDQGESNDVVVTHRALIAITQAKQETIINVEDCGAAYRFLMALLSVTPGTWRLTGTRRLLSRPIEELVDVLRLIGADIRRETIGWTIKGKNLSAESLEIDCGRTSQYASALLLIAPKLGLKELHVCPKDMVSIPYLRLTQVVTNNNVDVPELGSACGALGKIGDWSAALFWYAKILAEPDSEYLLENLSLESAQGDSIIAEWFSEMGVVSAETPQGIRISVPNRVPCDQPRVFDVAGNPDVVPVMAALACLLPADFSFVHTRTLLFKESDRVGKLSEQLAPYADIDVQDDVLRVVGRARKHWPKPPYTFRVYNDHRLAMAFLLFSGGARLDDVSCMRKSYPELAHLC